jgi:hypothetical protein
VPQTAGAGNPRGRESSRRRAPRVNPRSVQNGWLGLAVAVAALSCGTEAVGVSSCRALERSRCAAAAACGFPDVKECQRFERDQCLHGVALEDVSSVELDACIQDIDAAGRCAEASGATTAANACTPPLQATPPTTTVCDVVRSPERASTCAFLVPGTAPAPVPVVPVTDGGA